VIDAAFNLAMEHDDAERQQKYANDG